MLGIYISVGLKSFQQLNVVHDRVWAIIPTSIVLTTVDYTVITWVVLGGATIYQCLALGFAAGCGCITATKVHRRTR
jgi:hypothetical protein